MAAVIPARREQVGQHQAANALRRLQRQVLADHAAHRQAAEVRAFDLQRVEQAEDIVGELFETVGAGRRVAAAVPARVEAQHGEAGFQRRHLRLPHGAIAAERM